MGRLLAGCLPVLLLLGAAGLRADAPPLLAPLSPQGAAFADPAGKPVRLWGVNLAGVYPDHGAADALAANLASLQINLVREHHMLRKSGDWNPQMTSGALVTYQGDTRHFDPDALDRFDYLNAALRRQGIYLAFSMEFTRHFLPGDADIAPGDPADRQAWMDAMKELGSWDWKKSFDLYKLLPALDERSALLHEEFLRQLLSHVNPYTGAAYGADSQVATYEVANESSFEYAVICQNRFPAYWADKLAARWAAFAQAEGIEPGDLYAPADAKAVEVRGRFLRGLDEAYFARMRKALRATGCRASLTYSNLWRGDNALRLHAAEADHIENHMYMDPLVAGAAGDGFHDLAQCAVAGKPFLVGELNQAEGGENIAKQSPWRTMLPLAAAAYGSLQDWSGITWFAWAHGAQGIGPDGWSAAEGRASDLGRMMNDGMMIDHLRTAGAIFRRGLVAPSREPVTLWIGDDAPMAKGYFDLVRSVVPAKPGWEAVHGMRKAFGPVPAGQAAAPWMTGEPPNPVTSDTGQIVKDTARRQLTVAAPAAEGFSGFPDAAPPAGLKHLALDGNVGMGGFATVIAVADDSADLGSARSVIVSRTGLDASHADSAVPAVRLRGLAAPGAGERWFFHATRPRPAGAEQPLAPGPDGSLSLPALDWHEGELRLHS